MFLNAFRITLRSLMRHRLYAFINLFGLAVGLACCLLLIMHVRDEFAYDDFHPQGDRLYRLALNRIYPDHTTSYAIIPQSMGEAIGETFPEITHTVRLFQPVAEQVIRLGERRFRERQMLFADSGFFQVFGFSLLAGNAAEVLNEPNEVVVTASTALRYFGSVEAAMGQVISPGLDEQWRISGVCADPPAQSHLAFDLVGSLISLPFIREEINYISFATHTYFQLAAGTDATALEAKIPAVVDQYASGQIERRLGVSYEDYRAAGNGYHYFFQPVGDIHLHSQLEGEIQPNGDITAVYLFLSIALFILLIACINFMNLATARSAERAREVGVRKVLGGQRQQLIRQFLAESTLLAALSTFIALVLAQLALPFFNELAAKSLTMQGFFDGPGPYLLLLGLMLAVGLVAGSYPAFVLSAFEPARVLKGVFRRSRQGIWLRNGLVVFQFSLSMVLIAATAVVYQQLQFTQQKNLGFTKDQVLVVERAFTLPSPERKEALRTAFLQHPEVEQVSYTNTLPGGYYFGIMLQQRAQASPNTMRGMVVDDHFIPTLGLNLVRGRGFSPQSQDSLHAILNETALKEMGLDSGEDPIGKRIYTGALADSLTPLTIIGVVEDFHYQSLHSEIGGLVLLSVETGMGGTQIALRLNQAGDAALLSALAQDWQQLQPDEPFAYHFLDQRLAKLYASEERTGQLFGAFAGLAILIACVGLFGLSTYTAEQRAKEIGIRKVLGASVRQVLGLLSREVSLLVGVAFGLAVPLIWWGMNWWLGKFAYSINLGAGVFALAGFTALFIAWGTVSYQAWRAATANPVRALRNE